MMRKQKVLVQCGCGWSAAAVSWVVLVLVLATALSSVSSSGLSLSQSCLQVVDHMATPREMGIDVSHHNGEINWEKVRKTGVTFCVAKATEGNHYTDPTFQKHWEGMKRNNIRPCAYHYLRGSQTPESQVAHVLQTLEAVAFNGINDILAIDVEESGNTDASPEQMAETLYGVLNGLKSKIKNIYIYTGPNYWEHKLAWKRHDFSQYPLWIAHYTKNPEPTIPSTWGGRGYTWWQYSSTGRVDGIKGSVDLDRVK